MTAVKVGDRVRATCGENVIVGVVERADDGGCYVKFESCSIALWLFSGDWTVEVLAPSVPDVVGTIVTDRLGAAWQRDASGWKQVGRSGPLSLGHTLADYGPLFVLWTPEGES